MIISLRRAPPVSISPQMPQVSIDPRLRARVNYAEASETEDRAMTRKLLLGITLLAPLSLYPFLRDNGTPKGCGPCTYESPSKLPPPLTSDEEFSLACMSIFPGQSFPAAIPWEAMRVIGQQ